MLCYAGTSAERAQETLDVTLRELGRLGDGIDDDELDRLQGRVEELADHAAGIELRSQRRRSPATGIIWGACRTLDEFAAT